MTGAGGILAAWLSPAIWLALPALFLAQGSDALWAGLLVVAAPLLALSLRRAPSEPMLRAPVPLIHVATLFLAVVALVWAGLIVAGDVALRLGGPRWHGIVLAACGAFLLTAWRGSARMLPALLLIAAFGLGLPLVQLARVAGMGPLEAWRVVATSPAFTFPPGSPWVAEGRDLRLAQDRRTLHFQEEHRLTAAGEAVLRLGTRDGRQSAEREISLAAGQSLTVRPGDRLEAMSGARLRFEAGRRVPGAPETGVAWAAGGTGGGRAGLLESLGLAVTMLGGGIALLGPPLVGRPSRRVLATAGAALVGLIWLAQGWAVYTALRAPEVFLGGISPEGLLDVPGLVLASRSSAWRLQTMLVVAVAAGFLASTVALRARLSAADTTGGGEIGSDLGLWSMVFGVAALASLWAVDPWRLALAAFGAAAAVLVPAALLPTAASRPMAATAAGVVGLAVFALLLLARHLGGVGSWLLPLCDQPALVAVPAGALALWLAARRAGA
jgi:hypothetical protein